MGLRTTSMVLISTSTLSQKPGRVIPAKCVNCECLTLRVQSNQRLSQPPLKS
jgi:hypothetical protein